MTLIPSMSSIKERRVHCNHFSSLKALKDLQWHVWHHQGFFSALFWRALTTTRRKFELGDFLAELGQNFA